MQLSGAVFKNGKLLVSDFAMIRSAEKNQYVPLKLNAWSSHGCPLMLSLSDGPGDQVLWSDWIGNSVGMGDPSIGKFKAVAEKLNRPVAVLMSPDQSKIYVAEYGAGQITEVSLADGAKRALATGLEGPLGLALIDDKLYVAEAKPGRISKVDLATGKTEVFLSGAVGKVGALANDGKGNLLALDTASGKLFRISPKKPALSVVAENVPVTYALVGSYPTLELPAIMTVDGRGNIYIVTSERGLIELEKKK
jgi:hypothetical protein